MKQEITIELPESVIEQAQAIAKKEGLALKALLAEVIENGLSAGQETQIALFPTETPYGNEDASKIMQEMIQSSTLPKVIKKP